MAKSDLSSMTLGGEASKLAEPFVVLDFPVIDLSGDHRLPAYLYENGIKTPASDKF